MSSEGVFTSQLSMHVTWLGHRDFADGMQVRCGPRMGPNPRAGVFIGRRAKTQALTCNDTGPGVMCPRLRGHPRLLAIRSPGDWPAEPSRPCQHLCSRLRAAHVVKGNVSLPCLHQFAGSVRAGQETHKGTGGISAGGTEARVSWELRPGPECSLSSGPSGVS